MNLEELQKSVNAIAEKLPALDKGAELTALTEKMTAAEAAIRELKQAAPAHQKNDNAPLTLGAEFVKSDAFNNFASGSARKAHFVKTTATLGTNATTTRVAKIGSLVAEGVLSLADAMGSVPTSSTIIEFVQEKSWTNSAAAVLEAGQKPESAIEFEPVQAPCQVIAHLIPVTKQLIADAPALAALIDSRMEQGVKEKLEDEILNGSGLAPHLKGIMTSGNYTAHGLVKGTGETNLDLIRKCKLAISVSGFTANAVILNPSDYDAIMAERASDGKYLMLNPAAAEEPRLWGLRVIQSSKVAQGNFLVADLSQADVYKRQEITLEAFEQHEDYVARNLVCLRAEMRAALAVYSPLAFVGGALW